MTTFRPRSCPRCHGDIYRDNDPLDDDWYCLQCGRSFQDPSRRSGCGSDV